MRLIRSQHPNVSAAGAESFDLAMIREDASALGWVGLGWVGLGWVGPLLSEAKVITHLPTRLGGLGMFRYAVRAKTSGRCRQFRPQPRLPSRAGDASLAPPSHPYGAPILWSPSSSPAP